MFEVDQVVKRSDNGRRVRIVEIRPVGLSVFYQTQDMEDGHTAIFGASQLRVVEVDDRMVRPSGLINRGG